MKAVQSQRQSDFESVIVRHEMDDQFTGAYPRYSGAISPATGGPPEGINEMPATGDPSRDGTIYDEIELPKSRSLQRDSTPRKVKWIARRVTSSL